MASWKRLFYATVAELPEGLTPFLVDDNSMTFSNVYMSNKNIIALFSHLFHDIWSLIRIFEPRCEKTCFCHMRTTKARISLRIHAIWSLLLLYAALIILYLYLLNPKFQDPSSSLKLSRLVWVVPGRKPEDRFSRDEAHLWRSDWLHII